MFDYELIYKAMVERFPSGSVFLEIGSFCGKSGCYMSTEIYNSGKDIKWHMVDSWAYDGELSADYEINGEKKVKGMNAQQAKNSANKAVEEFKNFTTIHPQPSEVTCDKFENKTLDFVWVDGNHSYAQCKLDIESWLPKMKPNGIIAGHDYHDGHLGSVVKAVRDTFGSTSYINYEYIKTLIDLPVWYTEDVYRKRLSEKGPHAISYGSAWLIDLTLHNF